MPRPSRNLDRRLIEAARELLPETGLGGLSVRAVARRAGVNAGMFHYHFHGKKQFVRRVLEEVYGDFLVSFREAAASPGGVRERLRRVLTAYGRFAREHREMYALMMRELANAQPDMIGFARANFSRHAAVMMALMDEGRRKGAVRDLPCPVLCMFAMSSMGVPSVAATALLAAGRVKIGGLDAREFARMALSDEMIETRADMVLAALAPPRRKR